MTPTFDIFSIETVKPTYSWDSGTPVVFYSDFVTTLSALSALSNNSEGVEYVGYAPFMKVSLSSELGTTEGESWLEINRKINFGDFYNSETNYIETQSNVSEIFCHVYVMPGLYTLSFLSTKSETVSGDLILSGDCIQKHCIDWSWKSLSVCTPELSVTWRTTLPGNKYQKIWDFEPCEKNWKSAPDECGGDAYIQPDTTGASPLQSTSTTQVIIKESYIRVLEIPPVAYLSATNLTTSHVSPLTVRLSPAATICGSFPIERIVWDLGDGSPLLVQRRWANTEQSPFVYSGILGQDNKDPRNYDVVHTYTKTPDSDYCFYPSITAYCSSTNSSDCASLTIGPLKLPSLNTENVPFKLMQTELTEHGKVLLGEMDNNIVAWRVDK